MVSRCYSLIYSCYLVQMVTYFIYEFSSLIIDLNSQTLTAANYLVLKICDKARRLINGSIVTRNNIVWKLARGYCLCYYKAFLLVSDSTECTIFFLPKCLVHYLYHLKSTNISQRKTTNAEKLWKAVTALWTKQIRSTIVFMCSFHLLMSPFHSVMRSFHLVMRSFHISCALFSFGCVFFSVRYVIILFDYLLFSFGYGLFSFGYVLFSFRYVLFPLFALFMRSFYALFLCALFMCSFYALFLCALF